MKKLLSTLSVLLLVGAVSAQTKEHKLGVLVGMGPQFYKGDLGNDFTPTKGHIWRYSGNIRISYYLNRSFDATYFSSLGDMGITQSYEKANTPLIDDDGDQCPGCVGRVGLSNLSSRIYTNGLSVKYKFANGYLLKEKSILRPYVFAGAAYNHVTDRMKMNCIVAGNYTTINAGAGLQAYVTKRVNIGYELSAGYFTSDKIDFMDHGSSDMYVQSNITLGIDLF